MRLAASNSISRRLPWVFAAAAIALASNAPRASAEILGTNYSVYVAPSERVLAAVGTAQFDQVLLEESCDNPHLRVRARNKPSIMITNGDSASAPITSFSLQINEGPYFFGDGDSDSDNFTGFIRESIFYTDDGVSVTGSSVSADGAELTVLLDGLTAGKSVIFSVDIDADDPDMFPFPDYRTAFFGAPLTSIADPTAPASFAATYSDGEESKTLGRDFDQQTDPMIYYNGNIRPYHVMDMIEITETPSGQIPEPATWALAMLALGGLKIARRQRRIS